MAKTKGGHTRKHPLTAINLQVAKCFPCIRHPSLAMDALAQHGSNSHSMGKICKLSAMVGMASIPSISLLD